MDKTFFATFGSGQAFHGYYFVILAETEVEARRITHSIVGNDFCTTYSKETFDHATFSADRPIYINQRYETKAPLIREGSVKAAA